MSTPDFDPELERRWRALSTEAPAPRVDEAIRAAARRAAARHATRRRPTWQRLVPFAAAAAVGVIAFVLVRQGPTPVPTATPQSAPTTVPAPVAAPAPSPVAPMAEESTSARSKAPPAVATESREREVAREQRIADAPSPQAPATDDIAGALRAHVPDATRAIEVPGSARATAEGDEGLPARLADRVKADAATRLGVDPAAVTLVSAEAVTWSDGSLGCRTPGEMAIQVLTPGFRVVVDAGGTRLVYHTDTREQFRFCPRAGAVR
ncbi:MAG: hypothetical protein AB7G76_05895 [Steroidobacteraceae bacterium]